MASYARQFCVVEGFLNESPIRSAYCLGYDTYLIHTARWIGATCEIMDRDKVRLAENRSLGILVLWIDSLISGERFHVNTKISIWSLYCMYLVAENSRVY